MAEFQNRTLICSVLFIDIAEYSRKPVIEQIELKDRFNALLSDALRGVAVNDRIILDTGDGAAISFISDPEDALFVATGFRDVIADQMRGVGAELATRMGINLGPVRLVKDINGQPNIIGDGINVAQRVMSFARPGQVLVSRSYYEVVSRLSDESSTLFSYEGSRTDKHIREHEVYAVGAIPAAQRRQDMPQQQPRRAIPVAPGVALANAAARGRAAVDHFMTRPRLASAVTVAAILTTAFGVRTYRGPSVPPLPELPHEAPAAGAPTAAVPTPAASIPVAEPAPPPPPRLRAEAPERRTARPAPRVESMPVATLTLKKTMEPSPIYVPAERVVAAPPPAPPAEPPEPAPWGEIHVNGRMRGVSPPLHELELAPGNHRIEIRNAGSTSHVVNVQAKAGERLRIKHKFN
jgi:hypothetical protein